MNEEKNKLPLERQRAIDKPILSDFAAKSSEFANSGRRIRGFKGRVKPVTGYGGDEMLRAGLGVGSGSSNRNKSTSSMIEEIAKAKGVEDLRVISNNSKTNQSYAEIINFFKTMYYYRYTVVPVFTGIDSQSSLQGEDLLQITNRMLKIVDSANLESVLPNFLESGLYNGAVAIYLEKNGDQVFPYLLPIDYCDPFLESNYGTKTVVFDLDYFDVIVQDLQNTNDMGLAKKSKEESEKNKEIQKAVLDFYPKELKKAYLSYKGLNDNLESTKSDELGPQYVNLDETKAAYIPFSPSGAPPKIKSISADERYEKATDVIATKNKAGLNKIMTHQIPFTKDGDLAITYTEAKAVQEAMSKSLSGDNDVKVLTTIGDTELHDMQSELNERNQYVRDMMDSIYQVSGINAELFRSNTDYALKVSLGRSASFVWDILQKIITFYNLSINQHFKSIFGEYTCSISLLPINIYNEEESVNAYRRSAEYGIGKLEAIVATGQKQKTIHDKLRLEEAMNLDALLTPLQSSHTRSSKEVGKEKESEEPSKQIKEKETKENTEEVKDV